MAGRVWVNPAFKPYLDAHLLDGRESAENADRVSSLFGIPYNIAVGRGNQFPIEYGLANGVLQLAKKQLEVSGISSEPHIMIIGKGKRPTIMHTTWAIGNPHRNPLTNYLASDVESETAYGLTPSRCELPYRFHVPKETLRTRGYLAYNEPDEPCHGLKDDIENSGSSPEEKMIALKMYSTLRRKREEPATTLIGHRGELVPEYYGGPGYLDRFTRDYWTIMRMPLHNEETRGMGQTFVVLAGCHDLGTLHAVLALYDRELLEEMDHLRGHPSFQIVGYGDKGGDRGIIDATVF
ncbi:MAG: hypothetical protein HY365_01360 [Candidatus Aenigmarchaeota archaeon]|nr:hypothetical protein [Candidatus Aenigmarchaeota archaeon]